MGPILEEIVTIDSSENKRLEDLRNEMLKTREELKINSNIKKIMLN